MGLRDKKAARIKLNILEQTIELIGKGSFKDLFVEDICEKVEISKVTFFKYFPKKEDILVYFMQVWSFHRIVELRQNPKVGLEAIRYLFNVLGEDCDENPGLMLSLIGYISNLNSPPESHEIKYEERKLLYPNEKNLEEFEMLDVNQMFEIHLKEAAELEEIESYHVNERIINLLITVFYGTALTAHIKQIKNISSLYQTNLEHIVEVIK